MGVESVAVFEVPTVSSADDLAYGPPKVPVLVSATETIRVLLGTLDPEFADKPDLFLERRRNGWMIAIHPTNADPSGIVYLFDDGRTVFVRCEPDTVCMLDGGASVSDELDGIRG
jgi:hypothetical protein